MSVYQSKAKSGWVDMVRLIVSDAPVTITRYRETHSDPFRGETEKTAGPYTARIDEFRVTRNKITYDEKGSGAEAPYLLLGVDIPQTVTDGTDTVPTFAVDDRIEVSDGRTFYVTSPPRWDSGVVTLNIDLRG